MLRPTETFDGPLEIKITSNMQATLLPSTSLEFGGCLRWSDG